MASGDSGDSPSNAAIAAMEGGEQWPGGILFIYLFIAIVLIAQEIHTYIQL